MNGTEADDADDQKRIKHCSREWRVARAAINSYNHARCLGGFGARFFHCSYVKFELNNPVQLKEVPLFIDPTECILRKPMTCGVENGNFPLRMVLGKLQEF